MTDAITREEKLLAEIADGSGGGIEPITREELFLAKLAGQDVQTPEPITRKEKLLADAIKGISGGGENWLDYATSLNESFRSAVFNVDELDITFGSKAPPNISGGNVLTSAFTNCNGPKKLKVDTEAVFSGDIGMVNFCNTNYKAGTFEKIEIPFLSKYKIKSIIYAFKDQVKLKEIYPCLDVSACKDFSGVFNACEALETVNFVNSTIKLSISFAESPSLSDESIQSIIDGLATVETAQTLTLHADVKAKLTEPQITTITGKNWTLA